MKVLLPNTILAITLTLPAFIFPTVYANNTADEAPVSQKEQGIGIGFGSGAVVGGLVAGPVGIVTGALIGSLVGQNIVDENKVTTLTHSNQKVTNQYKITNEKLKTLEEENTRQSIVLNNAYHTIEKLFSQNQELKNHALNIDVQFRTNSIDIEKQYRESLKDLAKSLDITPNLEIEVAGFADRMGDEDFNMHLSNQRAKQVKEFLISQGIEEDRITTLAHGETQPLHTEESLENNFFDRRVSVVIMPKDISTENIAEEIIHAENEWPKERSLAIK